MLLVFLSCWCRHYAADFSAVGAAVYTTATVNAARFVGRWCKRYTAQFSAVGAAVYTTVRVYAARFWSAVGVGVRPPNLTAVAALRREQLLPVVFEPLV